MAVAMIYPEPEKGGRGKKSLQNREFTDKTYLGHARTVLNYAPEHGDTVLSGAMAWTARESLSAAYRAKP